MRFSTSTLGTKYNFQPKSVVGSNHLGNVLTVVSDRKIAVASAQDWLDEFTNNDALNQAAAWSTVAAPSNAKSIDTDRLKFTSSNVGVGLGKAFSTPAATGTNYQLSFDLDKGTCTQIKIEVFTAPAQSPAAYSNIVSASGTYVIPFTDLSAIARLEVTKTADNGVTQSFYLDNIKLNNLTNPSQLVAYFTPDIISANDYGCFGNPLSGRSFNSNSYKYGFNGMEKDDELKGNGNSYTTLERGYDPRLGRWLSIDKYEAVTAGITPYRFGLNNPIKYSDSEGSFEIDEATAAKYPNLKPALQNLLTTLQKPENSAKLELIMKLGEFKNKEEVFKVLTDGQGPKLKVEDIIDFKITTKTEMQFGDFGQANTLTTKTISSELTETGKELGLTGPAVAYTKTSGTEVSNPDGSSEGTITSETVSIDDAVGKMISNLFNKKGAVKDAEAEKLFNSIIIHEIGHVGDNRDGKYDSAPGAGNEVGEATEKALYNEVAQPTERLSKEEPK